ncbi:MAG: DUF1638 domain-containing protein, partial [Actinomycetota bacterium]
MPPERPRILVIGCGAIARELLDVVAANGLTNVTVTCLPARYHNTPDSIPDAVEQRIRSNAGLYDRIFVAYADCGTGGTLD